MLVAAVALEPTDGRGAVQLMEVHGDYSADVSAPVERPAEEAAPAEAEAADEE